MTDLVAYTHNKGAKFGWYHNNCDCSENQAWNSTYVDMHYNGDVNAIVGMKFDEVKLDGCGEFKDLDKWANLLNATGRPVLIENCHWGGDLPTLTWCPFNFFRTSGDISASWNSFFSNLQTTIKFQDYNNPLSRPGCWAYPDMLEVGNLPNYNQDRAHFGAWVIVSAPLILGFDVTNSNTMNLVWDIITNPETIAISQTWANHPGMLVKSWNPGPPSNSTYMWAVDCNSSDDTQIGFSFDTSTGTVMTPGGLCLDATTGAELMGVKCSGSSNQKFTYTAAQELKASNGQCVDVYDFSGPVLELYSCNSGCNQHFTFPADGTFRDTCNPQKCIAARQDSPSGGDILQLWAKPQLKGAVAAFVLNSDPSNAYTVDIDLKSLNITSTVTVRDIWQRKDLGTASGTFTTDAIPGYDSRMYLFTPQ